jgi:hypothetical protein
MDKANMDDCKRIMFVRTKIINKFPEDHVLYTTIFPTAFSEDGLGNSTLLRTLLTVWRTGVIAPDCGTKLLVDMGFYIVVYYYFVIY